MARLAALILCAAVPLTRTATPRAQHFAQAVDKGQEVVISLPGYDSDGDPLSTTITSLPSCSSQNCRKNSAGKLYQLSQVYDKHGHGSKIGAAIKAGDKLTSKGNRLVYVRPKNDRKAHGMWSQFKYTVTEISAHTNSAQDSPRGPETNFAGDGNADPSLEVHAATGHKVPGTSTEGIVTMTTSDMKVVESTFATSADSWTIVNTDGLMYNGVTPPHLKRTEAYLYNADQAPAYNALGDDYQLHRGESYLYNDDGHRNGVPTKYTPVETGGHYTGNSWKNDGTARNNYDGTSTHGNLNAAANVNTWNNEKFRTGVALPSGPNGDVAVQNSADGEGNDRYVATSADFKPREAFMYGDAQYAEAVGGAVNEYLRQPVPGHGTDSQGYMFQPTNGRLTAGGESDTNNPYSHLQTQVGHHPSTHLSQPHNGQLAGTEEMNQYTIHNKGEHQLHNYRKGQPLDPAYYGAQAGTAAMPAHYKFKDHRGPVFYPISERAHANKMAPKWERSSRGKGLSQYIHHTDKDIKVDGSGSDEKLWYFTAPAKFLKHQGISYGGALHFTQSASTGDFSPANLNSHPAMVILECATCKDISASTTAAAQFNKGVRLVYHSSTPFDGTTTKFKVDFKTGVWYKDPKNVLNNWPLATECELIEVLSHLTGMYILGDHTKWYETVALDDVFTTAGKLPIAFSQTQPGGHVDPTERADCYVDYTCRQTGDC